MGSPRLDLQRFHDALREQGSLDGCGRLFRETAAPFGFIAYACGEVDLADRGRNVTYLADGPSHWKPEGLESWFLRRDPVIGALGLFRQAFTFADIARDPRACRLEQDLLRAAAAQGWTQGLVVPVGPGGTRFGLVSLAGAGESVEGLIKSGLCVMSAGLLARARALVRSAEAAGTPGTGGPRLAAPGRADDGIAARLRRIGSVASGAVERSAAPPVGARSPSARLEPATP